MDKIAVDAMGGDFAPLEIVKGAVLAVRDFHVPVVLVGDKEQIVKVLKDNHADQEPLIEICHASQVIGMGEHPGMAFRKKKDASVSVGAKLVLQNALMGYVYAKKVWHIENPRIGLLNIGEESTKGSPVVTEAYEWLSGQKVVPFAGNAEGRDIMSGEFDVIVTDGFTGNVVLKFGEGAASLFSALLKKSVEKGGLRAKLGAFLLKPALKKYLVKRLDYAEYGGAPLMGIKGGLIICHGASQAWAIRNAIHMAKDFCEARVVDVIAEAVVQIEKEEGRLKED